MRLDKKNFKGHVFEKPPKLNHTNMSVFENRQILMPQILYVQWHEISNNIVCVTSKGSDQPAHMRSLIRAFACHLNIL